MTTYVTINEDINMGGAELEHGRVYPVESVEPDTGRYKIRDADDWPYEFDPSEVTEVPLADWEYELLHKEGAHGVEDTEDAQTKIEKESARLADEQRRADLHFYEYVEPEVDETQKPGLWEALNGLAGGKKPEPYKMTWTVLPESLNPDNPSVNDLKKGIDISGFTTTFELGECQEAEEDDISNPSHYSEGMPEGTEVRDVIKAQGFWKEFCAGNVIKYSLRWQYKNGIEDLKKMLQYGQWLVEELEDEDA